jgi:ABC-type transporter Mla MlaB component
MLRITRIESSDATQTFKLEGKLLKAWVSEVLHTCTASDGTVGRRCLDLSALTFADQSGTNLLKELVGRGLEVSACSNFVAELLHLENR